MLAITGATGNLGQLVIDELLKTQKPGDLIALVRNPAKAGELSQKGITVRKADYDQPESWVSALKGIKKLLLISSSEVGKRAVQHANVIRAAKEAGVQQILYTSVLRADTSTLSLAKEHLETEKLIQASGLAYTFLRNGGYIENHTEHLASALQTGLINGAAGEGRFSSATRRDFAVAAARVLTNSGHENKIYELAGDQSFTLKDLAAAVSKWSKKNISYANHPFADFKGALVGVGLPEPMAHLLADSDVGASKGQLESSSRDLSRLIGRATTPLAEVLSSIK